MMQNKLNRKVLTKIFYLNKQYNSVTVYQSLYYSWQLVKKHVSEEKNASVF